MKTLEPYLDPARVTAGTAVKASFYGAEDTFPGRVELQLDGTRSLVSTWRAKTTWVTVLRDEPVEHRVEAYAGAVASNLWSSAAAASMDPSLMSRLADVFAWDLDFSRDIQEGDRWRLAVDHLYVQGEPVGWGDVLAAEYDSGGTIYSAVHYEGPGVPSGYYAPDGQGLQSTFLKSPLKYAHVTSGFSSRRFHPVLKVQRPHLGVDYGAPTGTPIMAVGEGTITIAARRGPSGNMIALKHNGVYETQYKHLSRFAAGVVPGAHVQMGQVIGYVGQTGLATGPHLHFEFHVRGQVVDPTRLKFEAGHGLPAAALAHFHQVAAKEMRELPPWSRGQMAAVQGVGNAIKTAE